MRVKKQGLVSRDFTLTHDLHTFLFASPFCVSGNHAEKRKRAEKGERRQTVLTKRTSIDSVRLCCINGFVYTLKRI